jgi:hypothetical protein
VRGWAPAELAELRRLDPGALGERVSIVPSALLAAAADLQALQPFAGRVLVEDDAVYFAPRFRFRDGVSYTLLVRHADQREAWTIARPAPAAAPATRVVGIYPSAAEVPVNLLKLYVQFSAPMSEGWAARAVTVRRAYTGEPLATVFLASDAELWDRERRRLTLLLDPGRIKRGLAPNTEAGYPLRQGIPIVVSVDASFRDAGGRPLLAGAERRYEVGPAVRARVDPAVWLIEPPRAYTSDPLCVTFERPLDRALLQHCLWVLDASGEPVAGHGAAGEGERRWHFTPGSAWKLQRYLLAVDPKLEDLAGNSVARVFDRDLARPEDAAVDPRPVLIELACASG